MTLSTSNVKPLKKVKKMKKFILSLGLIAAALCLTNCSQNDDFVTTEQTPSTPFELFAPITKTTNDGLNTLWTNGDDLTVFHAESGTTDYVENDAFTLADASTGRFTGNLVGELTAESYDWYVTYPYYKSFTNPGAGHANNIGCTATTGKQTQDGNNSSAHISGKYLPLIGVAKGVAAGETPAITLRNAASFAKFTITNKLSEPITITSVAMTAEGYKLVGEFYIKIAEEPVRYVPTSSGALDTALLEVTNGEAIAAGESATFYMAVAPFALTESSTVSFKVVATNSAEREFVCTKSVTPAAGWGFTAGQYKDIKFGFEVQAATIAATTAKATDTTSSTGTTATLNGSYAITNASGEESVTCGFEYKLSSASDYTSVTAESAATFTYALTELTADSEYTFRAWASLDGGATKSYGADMTFTTTKTNAGEKSISLTKADIANVNAQWGYPDTDIKEIKTAEGLTWSAYQSARNANGQTTVNLKASTNIGYLATPVVNGIIKRVSITLKGSTENARFAIYSSDVKEANYKLYTSEKLGASYYNTQTEYQVSIASNVSQLYFRSDNATINIQSVTVYYE